MKDVYICRCEEVTRKEIEDAIKDGATTLEGLSVEPERVWDYVKEGHAKD